MCLLSPSPSLSIQLSCSSSGHILPSLCLIILCSAFKALCQGKWACVIPEPPSLFPALGMGLLQRSMNDRFNDSIRLKKKKKDSLLDTPVPQDPAPHTFPTQGCSAAWDLYF